MTTNRPAITLVQPVPDAAWFERQIWVWRTPMFPGISKPVLNEVDVVELACHLRGNLSVNRDAVLVDGPTLREVLVGALASGTDEWNHAYGCTMNDNPSNPCTCWRATAKAMLESLKEAMP